MAAERLTPRQLAKVARDLESSTVRCRAFKHAWDYQAAGREGRNYWQTLVCLRGCGVSVEVVLDPAGYVLRRKMTYPEKGYLLPKGSGPVTREVNGLFRVESLLRNFEARDLRESG